MEKLKKGYKNSIKRKKRILPVALTLGSLLVSMLPSNTLLTQAKEEVITLRVCNWEEYLDLGEWDEEERIELDNGVEIFGEQPLFKDFEEWFYQTYHKKVEVEYSCFGTNEDLYNQLTLGDTYDLVCPSDYMIMKLIAEDKAEPFSEEFYHRDNPNNYYINGVSPYIAEVFENNEIQGKIWKDYAACYMWGVTGVLYNPEYVTYEEASTWGIFNNSKFYRQVTLKDNVRDTYFAALGYMLGEELLSEEFCSDPMYEQKLFDRMNDVSEETIDRVEVVLQEMVGNIYALETDSGKSDMITGKIKANYQWSGDAVYAMDQAEEEEVYLAFAVPRECTNLWFDGWIMLKDGIGADADKKLAAEAFVNFLSRPDNAVRNMYYIGYTSSIAGTAEDDTVFSYLNYCYAAEDEEEALPYSLGYFFSGQEEDAEYIVYTSPEQVGRQLYTQYPSADIIRRAAIMGYYDEEQTRNINQMWINIRCFRLEQIPVYCYAVLGIVMVGSLLLWIIHRKRKISL